MSAASSDALGTARDLGSGVYRDEDFPGCESFPLPASELDRITKTGWSSGTASPRRRGKSASPPPFSTSSRRGAWCGWPGSS